MPKFYVTAQLTVVQQFEESLDAEDEDDTCEQMNELILAGAIRPFMEEVADSAEIHSIELIEE